jgi:hypothetical protein
MTVAWIALGVSAAAGIAGIVATWLSWRTLKWQQGVEADRRKTKVALWFEHAACIEETDPRAVALVGGPDGLPMEYRLSLMLVNASAENTIHVRDLYIEQADGAAGQHIHGYDDGSDIRLEPHERTARHVYLAHLDPALTADGFVGKARLASGEQFETPVERLDDHIVTMVEARNTRGRLDSPPPAHP